MATLKSDSGDREVVLLRQRNGLPSNGNGGWFKNMILPVVFGAAMAAVGWQAKDIADRLRITEAGAAIREARITVLEVKLGAIERSLDAVQADVKATLTKVTSLEASGIARDNRNAERRGNP